MQCLSFIEIIELKSIRTKESLTIYSVLKFIRTKESLTIYFTSNTSFPKENKEGSVMKRKRKQRRCGDEEDEEEKEKE